MVVKPSDSSKLVTRSVVTCCHFHIGTSNGCKRPAFSHVSDLMAWHVGHEHTYFTTSPSRPRQYHCRCTSSKVLQIPTYPTYGASWHLHNACYRKDFGTTISYWPPMSCSSNPLGIRLKPSIACCCRSFSIMLHSLGSSLYAFHHFCSSLAFVVIIVPLNTKTLVSSFSKTLVFRFSITEVSSWLWRLRASAIILAFLGLYGIFGWMDWNKPNRIYLDCVWG